MAVREAILGLLAGEERHGYEIKRRFETLLRHFWSVDYAQVYRHLAALEREGLVARRVERQDSRPDRKLYRLTEAGRAELRRWLQRADERPWQLQSEFYLKLALWDRVAGADLEPHIAAQERAYRAYLGELQGILAQLAHMPEHPLTLLADVGRRHAEVELAWLAELRERLGGGGDGGVG